MDFYKEYGRSVGFDARKHGGRLLPQSNIYSYRYMVCSRAGSKIVLNSDEVKRRRLSNRCECPAFIMFKYEFGIGYKVTRFLEEHNHDLVSEEYKVYLRVNRQLDHMHQKFLIDCASANIGPTHAHRLLSELLGGDDFVGCTVTDARNFSRDLKAHVEGVDAQMVVNQMQMLKDSCASFTFDYEVDAEDKLSRLFWCDGVSRQNYYLFGDVVAFDTTFSTNKYCMIFAPFTGKDNHGRPVTFAAGLLSKEDAASFTWLFTKFIACMGVQPKLIVTDQDLGMKVAVQHVLTETRHRWCMWHIMLKVSLKISKALQADEGFRRELNACVWSDLIEPEEFEIMWKRIMETYGLVDSPWFSDMFEDREFWVPAYFRDFPMSSTMWTTSISESENSFYKKYTNCRINLAEFILCFDSALKSQRRSAMNLDFEDKTKIPYLDTQTDLERHASTIYTASMFKKVQEEIKAACYDCALDDKSIIGGGIEIYKITDGFSNSVQVVYDKHNNDFSCSCKMMCRHGYVCSHMFLAFKNNKLTEIPSKYISDRWLKLDSYRSVHGIVDENTSSSKQFNDKQHLHNQVLSDVYSWLHRFRDDTSKLSDFLEAINTSGRSICGGESPSVVVDKEQLFDEFYGDKCPEKVDVHPPNIVKTKGSGSRLVSRLESALKKPKKNMRKCAYCKELKDHDIRNCPTRKKDEAAAKQ